MISAEAGASLGIHRRAVTGEPVARPVAVYRKRALTMGAGACGEVRCRRPAAEPRSAADMCAAEMRATTAEAGPAANMTTAEVRSTPAEMRRSAHVHAAAAEVSAATHGVRSATAAHMRCATSADMRPAAATAMTTATTTTASAWTCVSGARQSGRENNRG
jgi:hypothetical protein